VAVPIAKIPIKNSIFLFLFLLAKNKEIVRERGRIIYPAKIARIAEKTKDFLSSAIMNPKGEIYIIILENTVYAKCHSYKNYCTNDAVNLFFASYIIYNYKIKYGSG